MATAKRVPMKAAGVTPPAKRKRALAKSAAAKTRAANRARRFKRPAGVGSNATWDGKRSLWVEGDFWFDEKAADKAAEFFPKYLRLTKGEWARRPFILADWQANDIVRPLFGWKRPDGTRRYRRCYVWVPRKNGKTELAAGIGLLLLLGDAEPGAEIYSIAKDKDQASIVFEKASIMVNWSDALGTSLEVYKPSIFCPSLLGCFKPLTGRADGKHGLSMSGLVGDEVHEWPDDRLYQFVHQSSVSRRQPLEFMISTAGEKAGYGYEIWDYCQQVLAGTTDDVETLVVVYAANPEKDNWMDPKVWARVNPNYNVSVKPGYLAAEAVKAKELPRLENNFKRYHLNWWTEQAVRWLPIDKWDKCKGKVPWQKLPALMKGRKCYAASDLSSNTDLTCELLLFPPIAGEDFWTIIPRFFVPADNIEQRVRRDRVAYDEWKKDGAIMTTPGDVIDYDYLKKQILLDAEFFEIEQFGFDPFNATQISLQLEAEGMDMAMVRQGYLTLNEPSKAIERLMLKGKLRHGGHPVLRWCALNVAVETDAADNIKPSKKKSNERIDGMAALVSAMAVVMADGNPKTPSPWEDPDFKMAENDADN